jgi:hypothetical protein
MDQLQVWLEAQLAERRTGLNCGLGQAITYLLRHWQPLTLFLQQAIQQQTMRKRKPDMNSLTDWLS